MCSGMKNSASASQNLEQSYNAPDIVDKLWEDIYIEHIQELKMKLKKYDADYIFEFDTLDELGSLMNRMLEIRARLSSKI